MSANADDGAKGEPRGEAPGALSRLLDELARAPDRAPGEAWGRPLRPGDVLDRFEILRELGRGGFGAVYEALDRELGRKVALKTLRPGRSRDEWADEQLHREAQAAASLSHPGIVTLHEACTCDRGPYLVMELLRGETLESRLGRGPLPQAEAVEVGLQMARALAHVHGHGLVHRDLKPGNVFLGEDGRVKLLDLGLAHLLGRKSSTGGTPAYVAPEQWRGEEVDGRADVFALGAVLFEMVSGRRAFEVKEERSSALDPGPAPALSGKAPRGLARLVARCLAKEPSARPTAAQAAEELLGIQRGKARPRAVRRVGLLVGAGIAAGIAVALVALQAGRKGGGTSPDGRVLVAVADVVNETGERELDVLSGLLVTSLEQSRKLSVMTQARVLDLAIRAGRKDAARVDETIGREVGAAHGVRALLLPAIRKLGGTYSLEMRAVDPGRDEHLFTLVDRATSKEALLDLLDRLSERTRSALGEGTGEIEAARVQLGQAMTRSVEAYQHYVAGLEARFRHGLRAKALAEYLAALELDPGFAAARGQLAAVFHTYGRADLFVEHWREAERGIDRMPVKERTILQLQRSFDVDALAGWSREDALRLAREIETRFPDDKFALVFASGAYDTFDQPDRAEQVLRRVLDLDPGYLLAASLLSERLGPAEALEVARRAVGTSRSPANLWLLAEALRVAGDDVQSRATAREVLRQDGARNSFITQVACDALYQTGSDEECLAHWKWMAADGQNEYERDFARFKLMDALAFRGRIREALALAVPDVDASRASSPYYPGRFSTRPGTLAAILQVGRPRQEAPQAVEHARRITHPQYRRNWLAFLGALEEAEAIDRTLEGKGFSVVDDVYRYYGLVRDGRLDEAVDLARKLGEVVRRKNIVTSLYGVPLIEAEALLAAGRTAEAAEVRPGPVPCRCSDPIDYATNFPRLALLRARAMVQLGRRADASRELDGVLAFWKEADRDLPLLVEAKAMRRRLAAEPAAEKAAAASSPAAAKAPTATPSIAVLPFADLSPGKDQEYFADGVAEEILNALTQVRGLKVVGRTSSFSFKGTRDDLRSIGKKLGVAHVLEGSVRREGSRVRITAQLLNAADGHSLWSQVYERELTGVFQVQDEVARAVVASLEVKLMAGGTTGGLRPAPTTRPEVYEHYLLGRQYHQRLSYKTFGLAVRAYERALELDPGFAPAWAALGIPLLYDARRAPTRAEERAQQLRALAAAERALELAPDLPEGLRARGYLRQTVAWDWEGARADLERAVQLYPGDRASWHAYGVLLDNLGRSTEAIASVERAVALDPLSASWLKLGQVQEGAGRLDLARASLERARLILPESPIPRWGLAGLDLLEGRAQEALAVFEELAADGVASQKDVARALHSLGRKADAEAALAKLKARQPRVRPLDVASACAWMGQPDCAFEWLDRAWRERDGELGEAFRTRPDWRPLHSDPRWKPFLRRLNLPVD